MSLCHSKFSYVLLGGGVGGGGGREALEQRFFSNLTGLAVSCRFGLANQVNM